MGDLRYDRTHPNQRAPASDHGRGHVRSIDMRRALSALLVALAAGTPVGAEAQQAKPTPPAGLGNSVLLKGTADSGTIDMVEAPPGDPLTRLKPAKEQRQSVSDLAIRLETATGEPIATVLGLRNGERAGRRSVLLKAVLMLVLGGRLT